MSKRSVLRPEALERAGNRCEWVGCGVSYKLELAHLLGSQAGGSKHRDVPENCAMLCRHHHSVLDCRVSWKQAEDAVVALAWTVMEMGGGAPDLCMFPGCLVVTNWLVWCGEHDDWVNGRLVKGRRTLNEQALRAVLGRYWKDRR